MVQNPDMGIVQAVVRPGATTLDTRHQSQADYVAATSIEFVPNPEVRKPEDVAREHGARPLRLSTRTFVRIAALALEGGFRVQGFILVDEYGEELPDRERDEYCADLVAALTADGTYGVDLMLATTLRHTFIAGIDLYRAPGLDISIRGSGTMSTSDELAGERLILDVLRAARGE